MRTIHAGRLFTATLLIVSCGLAAKGQKDSEDQVVRAANSTAGVLIHSNANRLLVWTEDGLVSTSSGGFTGARPLVLSNAPIRTESERLPPLETVLKEAAAQSSFADIRQIPAIVIEEGILKNVPYVSFRCGTDLEINVYGDLDAPAGLEVGIYGINSNDPLLQNRCERLIHGLLRSDGDKLTLASLNWKQDLKINEGMTFETTPPSMPDAYGGWWISVYSTSALEDIRLTTEQLPAASAARPPAGREENIGRWTPEDFKLPRAMRPRHITFKNSFGTIITNAEITAVREGHSLEWKDAYGSGVVKLKDLPQALQSAFGYDANRAKQIEAAEAAQRAEEANQQRRIQALLNATAVSMLIRSRADPAQPPSNFSGGTNAKTVTVSRRADDEQMIWVNSYTRRDGRVVKGYYRRR